MKIYQFKTKPVKGILKKLVKGIYVEPFCISSVGIRERQIDGKNIYVAILKFEDIFITKSFEKEEEAQKWLENEFEIEIIETKEGKIEEFVK